MSYWQIGKRFFVNECVAKVNPQTPSVSQGFHVNYVTEGKTAWDQVNEWLKLNTLMEIVSFDVDDRNNISLKYKWKQE